MFVSLLDKLVHIFILNQFLSIKEMNYLRSLSRARCYFLQKKTFSTKTKHIIVEEIEPGISSVVLKKPPVNSLNIEFLENFSSTIKSLDKCENVKGILLSTDFHGKVFCAGLDILELENKSEDYLKDFWSHVNQWCMDLFGCSKPVVGALNGHAVAGGCAFALMTDYRVGFPQMKIGLTEVQMGIPVRMLNHLQFHTSHQTRFAEFSLLTGPVYSAKQALEAGMLDEVVELNEVKETALKELRRLVQIPSAAYSKTKMLMRRKILEDLNARKEDAIEDFARRVQSDPVQKIVQMKLSQIGKR